MLFRYLPSHLCGESELIEWCEKWYPAKVKSCHIVRICPGLKKKRNKHTTYSNKLDKALWKLENSSEGKRPTTRTGFFGLIGKI